MVMKYNPKTNRFENVGASPAGATTPTGTTIPAERGTKGSDFQSRRDRAARQRATRTGAVTPSTTVPKNRAATTTSTLPSKPKAPATAPSTSSDVSVTPEEQAIIDGILSGIITDPSIVKNYSDFYNIGVKSSGADAVTKARIAADAKVREAQINAKAQKEAARKAADILKRSGLETQTAYNTLAEDQYKDLTDRASQYYGGQRKTALANIDAATADFLKNLIAPTAYESATVAELAPEQQGLLKSLQAYGATGGQAAEQMATDTASNKFLADLMRTSNRQMQAADVDYFNALKNAASGGQMAARQGLESVLGGLQGQTTAQAEAIRRELLAKGIEALLSGNQNAANVIAGSQ